MRIFVLTAYKNIFSFLRRDFYEKKESPRRTSIVRTADRKQEMLIFDASKSQRENVSLTVDKTEHMFYTFATGLENASQNDRNRSDSQREVFRRPPMKGQEVHIMEKTVEEYYADNAGKLRGVADKILFRLGAAGLADREDFYSLANEVFAEAILGYDKEQSFDGYLYVCLCNRFKSELTRRNRQKRQIDRIAISIDTPVNEEDGSTLGDIIPDSFTIEKEIFEDGEEAYSKKMLEYLSRLSGLQREVLRLTTEEYLPNEIRAQLHISEKQYSDCNAAIHSYRNVSVLF